MMPAEVSHPSQFIHEELLARDWNLEEMIRRGGTDNLGTDLLAWSLYFTVHKPNMIMGEHGIQQVARAFGVSEDTFRNLERSWIEWATASSTPTPLP